MQLYPNFIAESEIDFDLKSSQFICKSRGQVAKPSVSAICLLYQFTFYDTRCCLEYIKLQKDYNLMRQKVYLIVNLAITLQKGIEIYFVTL